MNSKEVSLPERIRNSLGAVAMLFVRGFSEEEALKLVGISKAVYCHWLNKYHGMTDDQIKRMHALERQNLKLRRKLAAVYQLKLPGNDCYGDILARSWNSSGIQRRLRDHLLNGL